MASQLDIGAARRIDFDVAGQRIAALQAGRDDGPPVLLVPGYTGSKEDFGPILDPIADAGFRAIAIDLPGQLDSPALADHAGYDPQGLAPFVHGIVERLGAAVIALPDRFASLVLLGSGPAALGGPRRALIERLDPVLESGLAVVYAAMQETWRADPRYVAPPPAVAAFLERRFLSGAPAMMRGMGDALRGEPDRVAALAATGVRVLVTHGADDDAWPPPVQHEMAQRLGARYEVIPAAAHSPAVENPARTAAVLLDFWRSTAAQAS